MEEGLTEEERALFELLFKDSISKADRERLKQASRGLLASIRELLQTTRGWTEKSSTQAEVKMFIVDRVFQLLPRPPFTDSEADEIADRVYNHVWAQSRSGQGWAAV